MSTSPPPSIPPSMPTPNRLPPVTLIVATTPTLGIGLRGTLPWPPLKPDLAFFARVTKRVPAPASQAGGSQQEKIKNAVVMGRKTWESIPAKFRPLRGRINVVVSRRVERLGLPSASNGGGRSEEPVIGVGSIEEGLRRLQSGFWGLKGEKDGYGEGRGGGEGGVALGRVFVIGGADIYRAAIGTGSCERVLWTSIRKEFECDTYFPQGILPVGDGKEEGARGVGEWVTRSVEELREWTGEGDVGGVKSEGDVKYEVVMMEQGGQKDQ